MKICLFTLSGRREFVYLKIKIFFAVPEIIIVRILQSEMAFFFSWMSGKYENSDYGRGWIHWFSPGRQIDAK